MRPAQVAKCAKPFGFKTIGPGSAGSAGAWSSAGESMLQVGFQFQLCVLTSETCIAPVLPGESPEPLSRHGF